MRESGILMHITSLAGPYGIGTMGKSAYDFVDFLYESGQRCWQILPLSPTGYGDSPYQSCSTFAGNPYLIDLDLLVEEGLLKQEDLALIPWCQKDTKVDYGALYNHRLPVLRLAYSRFSGGDAYDAFCRDNSAWLGDYALYLALKAQQGGKVWNQWPEPLKRREPDAIWQARQTLKEEIGFHCFVQYLFFTQWQALRAYAKQKDITIIGDVPIYVPLDSADVWASPELFELDGNLDPVAVAGCPPDAFSEDGQLWGNPLYRWKDMEENGFTWWINRLAAAGRLYDVVRLDHFRAFEAYWRIPYGDKTAKGGKWVKGPDMAFIQALKKSLPELRLIAEDLGFLTQEVLDLRDASGYPGMKVLGFAFDSREPSDYLPHNYIANTVCYTGTHDNMTTRQWFDTAGEDAVAYACEYMNLSGKEDYVWGTIRTAMASVSQLCIVPIQDYLDLGAEGRMNFPGTTTDANWTWRISAGALTPALSKRIAAMTRLYGRLGKDLG